MNRIEHIGIAVRNLREAERVFEDLLGTAAYKHERVDSESVEVGFFKIGESKIELLSSTTEDGPIGKFVQEHGPGLHHLAFHVDDLKGELERLEELGYRVISGPKPGADQKIIAFLHPKDTCKVLIELCADEGR
ncbi:MAG: methylmalonyl-CoA epimerase [Bacteroidetes bacterium]|nr:methylmalonyl-CoA epimerase [Bacteroidota bacterium]